MMTATDFKLLLVEDNMGDYVLVSEYLRMVLPGSRLVHNKTLGAAVQSLSKDLYDIILLDLTLPDSNGIDSIKEIVALAMGTPVIVLTGFGDKQFGIDSLKLGVQDYLIKDEVTPAILLKSISYSKERKKNQLQLEQSEKRFRALIEKSTDGLAVIDEDGNIKEISPSGKQILGIPPDQLPDNFKGLVVYPDDKERLANDFLGVVGVTGSVKTAEVRIVMPGGNVKWIENTFHNLMDEPAVHAIVANFRDISERKKAAVLLQESEEKYRYLFDMNPETIFIWDPENLSFLDFNETCLHVYGFSKKELAKKNILTLRDKEEHDEVKSIAAKMSARQMDVYVDLWRLKKGKDELIYMNIASHRIIFNNKVAVLAIGNNVTEKVMLELQLEHERVKKQKEITDAVIMAQEKERDELGSELHDNVCQILASSKLYLGMLKKDIKNPEAMIDETDILITSAIEELRILSHSLIPPSLDEMELQQALEKIIDLTGKTTTIKIHSVIHQLDGSVSNKMRLAIYRIVQEQFNNILKHAKAKNIYVALLNQPGKLVLSVKDDGVGFDTSKLSEGVGLLNIKTRASLFNGEVNIISAVGKGTELTITFI